MFSEESAPFNIGDVVMVHGTGGGHYENKAGTLTGPFTIEKRHKGNGNLIVGGRQFSSKGWWHSSQRWSIRSAQLVLAGTPEAKAIADKIRIENLRRACRNSAKYASFDNATEEQLRTLLRALREAEGKTDATATSANQDVS